MRLFANLLLTVSLIFGMISAATAYLGYVESADSFTEEEGPARLKAPAGSIAPTEQELAELRAKYANGEMTAEAYTRARKKREAIISPGLDEGGTLLSSGRLAQLDDAGVETVFTKSFSFSRWRHWWIFLLSALGMFTGSMIIRRSDKAAIAEAAAKSEGQDSTGSPEGALQALLDEVGALRGRLDGMSDEATQLEAIRDGLESAQKTHVEVFVEARPLLIGRKGLAGYAELMDRFAAAERQINRSWCSAADGVLEESVECLATAEILLGEAQAKL